ncbi:MAG: DNA circularization N-terminal domain-containing protein [Capsulimonadaceae bacterium]|nr:DNA circularization N-terminal domain-containing protein [Capsulimonadaceae bacterium]
MALPLLAQLFRGISFGVFETGRQEWGRRTVTHVYPFCDTPYAKELGRKARVFLRSSVFSSATITNPTIEALETKG